MKNKIILIITVLIGMFAFMDVASADSQVVREGDPLYSTFASEYEKYPSINITEDNQKIVVYGYSKCTTTSGCEYSYQGVETDDIEDLLSSSISCDNKSTSINYSPEVSAATDFKSTAYKKENVEVYWSEEYTITCTSDGAVEVEDSSDVGSSSDSSDVGSSSDSSTATKDDYSSSSSEDNVDTGVETYYIVLIIVAIISYVIMRIVKKYNLFKNV